MLWLISVPLNFNMKTRLNTEEHYRLSIIMMIPLVLSSGSLSVPLVSSADIEEGEIRRKWRNGKDLRSHNQMQTVSLCFITSGCTYCSWPWVYHQKLGNSTERLNLILFKCWCGVLVCVCVLPRTEAPWFFTLFLPRLSSKIVSILLTYCTAEHTHR